MKNAKLNSIFLILSLSFLISSCDVEGEIRQGDISSTIAPNSGSAGGNAPVLGGVYYDSLDGLTISDSGAAGERLVLNGSLIPEWTFIPPALPLSGGTMLGTISMNGNFISGDGDAEGLFVDSMGYVGVGTDMPQYELHVVGEAYKTDGSSQWLIPSDQSLKKNIRPALKGLAEINQLKVKEFSYIKNNFLGLKENEEVGLIAQEVSSVFPEAILYSGQYMMLDYHPIYMAQIKSIQELATKNRKLELRLNQLEAKLNKLLSK